MDDLFQLLGGIWEEKLPVNRVLEKMVDAPGEEIERKLATMGTIDLHIDYLRPGRGRFFVAESTIMRTGNKVAVTHMELQSNEGPVIAVGTGTYLVG